ncbi:hypothetical protein [Devosia geojensis]|uniref:hypothetical protein n=1 Tax=Devosia geojensis TaxID=443610 RepID=UPI000B0FDE30|nr:hypothetical protein [Devosia geojensis]
MVDSKGIARNVGGEEFTRYIASKVNGRIECPICKNNIFQVGGADEGHSHAYISLNMSDPEIFGAGVAWTVLVICKNCWHVMPFLRQPITDWLDANDE